MPFSRSVRNKPISACVVGMPPASNFSLALGPTPGTVSRSSSIWEAMKLASVSALTTCDDAAMVNFLVDMAGARPAPRS